MLWAEEVYLERVMCVTFEFMTTVILTRPNPGLLCPKIQLKGYRYNCTVRLEALFSKTKFINFLSQ